jgi:hypothetical protein
LCLSYCFLKNFLREFRFLFDFLIRWEHLNLRTLKNWSKADFRKNFVFGENNKLKWSFGKI